MPEALITGIHGFVGSHLASHLLSCGIRVAGISRGETAEESKKPSLYDRSEVPIYTSDLSEIEQIRSLTDWSRFSSVYHLAGTAFVPEGWKNPAAVLKNNTLNTVNLLQSLRDSGFRGRFLFISSSDVYGEAEKGDLPLREESVCRPDSPYAASKFSAEMFCKYFVKSGIEVIIARPFNHIGPGQKSSFAVPSFIERIETAIRERESSIRVGDLNAERDFTDVRDVVEAYRLLIERGTPGEIYNVCSGKAVRMGEVLEIVMRLANANIKCDVDESLLRPGGTSARWGLADRIKALGWKPRHTLEMSIRDMRSYLLDRAD
jgi:GDP-4-dehydro-6-deoxy-D-mannose reductase